MRVLVLFFFLVANTAHAEVFKCVDKSTGKTTFTDTACPDKGTGTYVPVKPTNLDTANTEAARAAQARADYERNTTSSDGRRYFGGTETEALRAAQMEQAKKGDYGDTVSQQLANEGLTPERRTANKAYPSDGVELRQQQDERTIEGLTPERRTAYKAYPSDGIELRQQQDERTIERQPYGSSFGGNTDIEMRKKYDYDPLKKYRGEVESDGSVRMRNYDGDTLRGNIDSDGYGKLHDEDGNTYRVKPR